MGSWPVALGAVHRGPSPVPAAPELAEAGPWEHDLARRLAERRDRHPLREKCGHRQGMEKECWPATWPSHLGRRQAASPGPAGPLLSPHNFLPCIFPIKKQLDMNHHVVGGPSGGGGRTMVAKGLGGSAALTGQWGVRAGPGASGGREGIHGKLRRGFVFCLHASLQGCCWLRGNLRPWQVWDKRTGQKHGAQAFLLPIREALRGCPPGLLSLCPVPAKSV